MQENRSFWCGEGWESFWFVTGKIIRERFENNKKTADRVNKCGCLSFLKLV